MQGPGITAPSVVSEGGSFEVSVGNADKVSVSDPQTGEKFYVPVHNGRAKITLPRSVKGGTILIIGIVGCRKHRGATVEVVAQD